jgi:hypothetical protein
VLSIRKVSNCVVITTCEYSINRIIDPEPIIISDGTHTRHNIKTKSIEDNMAMNTANDIINQLEDVSGMDVLIEDTWETQNFQSPNALIEGLRDIFSNDVIVEEIPEEELWTRISDTVYLRPIQMTRHEELVVDLAITAIEAMDAEPDLAEVLPVEEDFEDYAHARAVSKTSQIRNLSVEDKDQVIGMYYRDTILVLDTDERQETLPLSLDCYRKHVKCDTPVKQTRKTGFRIEEQVDFPLSRNQFPNLLDRIETYLTCSDIFKFRCAFSNVDPMKEDRNVRKCVSKSEFATNIDRQDERYIEIATREAPWYRPNGIEGYRLISEERAIRNPALKRELLEVEELALPRTQRSKCICETTLYKDLWKIRKFGRLLRMIFNNHITLDRSEEPDLTVTIQRNNACRNHLRTVYYVKVSEDAEWRKFRTEGVLRPRKLKVRSITKARGIGPWCQNKTAI